jgi:hypothetical protein
MKHNLWPSDRSDVRAGIDKENPTMTIETNLTETAVPTPAPARAPLTPQELERLKQDFAAYRRDLPRLLDTGRFRVGTENIPITR